MSSVGCFAMKKELRRRRRSGVVVVVVEVEVEDRSFCAVRVAVMPRRTPPVRSIVCE